MSIFGKKPAAVRPGGNDLAGRILNAAKAMAAKVDYRLHVAAANLWRDGYNPLRSLTMSRAVSLLEDGERGAYAELQWLYRYIEMQDATLGALVERRLSAIGQMDWDIRESDRAATPEEKALAARQAAELKKAYEGIGNLKRAIADLSMASFRGFAHLEIVRGADGAPVELAHVPQWFWTRDGTDGEWRYNQESKFGTKDGVPVDMRRFLSREVDRPINRVALVAFLRKNLSQKDWDAFVETYGVPAIFLVMPPELGEAERSAFQAVAESIVGDARGVLPGNSDVKTVDNGARGVNPFRDHIKYQDEQIVLRGTGGKLTMLAESGSGTLAGGAHADTFEALARAEAAEISEIFRERLDKDLLDRSFPGQPHLAYFEIAANEETDSAAIVADVQKLAAAGYKVDSAWLEEKTGYKFAADISRWEETQKPIEMVRNRATEDAGGNDLVAAAAQLLAEARIDAMSPEADALRKILVMEDAEEMRAAAKEWSLNLPDGLERTGKLDAAWEKVLAAAFADGLEETKR